MIDGLEDKIATLERKNEILTEEKNDLLDELETIQQREETKETLEMELEEARNELSEETEKSRVNFISSCDYFISMLRTLKKN